MTRVKRDLLLPAISLWWGLAGLAAGTVHAGGPRPPDVLLITIDTLRADHLGCYGYRLDTSPFIDSLAREGVLFKDCSAQWPKTWQSMTSLMTGLYPRSNGVWTRNSVLTKDHRLLAEILKRRGYRTAAVIANMNLGREFDFDQGFDHFVESWVPLLKEKGAGARYKNPEVLRAHVKDYTNAEIVTDRALELVEKKRGGKPLFLWLHYIDPHGPYLPPARYASLFEGAYLSEPVELELIPRYQRQPRPGQEGTATDLGFYIARYDREIRHVDDQLRRLFGSLRGLGLDEDLLVIVTADHGESFGEHRWEYLEHGMEPYQPTAHVPLIVRMPRRAGAGKVVSSPVGLIDVAPTVLESVRAPVPAHFEGRSLLNLITGPAAATERWLFMESGYNGLAAGNRGLDHTQLTVRHGPWKLIHVRHQADKKRMKNVDNELYNLEEDPGERTNRVDDDPEVARALKQALGTWAAKPVVPSKGPPPTLGDDTRGLLESLGYKSLGYMR